MTIDIQAKEVNKHIEININLILEFSKISTDLIAPRFSKENIAYKKFQTSNISLLYVKVCDSNNSNKSDMMTGWIRKLDPIVQQQSYSATHFLPDSFKTIIMKKKKSLKLNHK